MRPPPRVIEHDRKSALVWGGPEHGGVIALRDRDRAKVLFSVDRPIHWMSAEPISSPVAPALQTVSYTVEKFYQRWSDHLAEVWTVLLYDENHDRLKNNFVGTMNLIRWMAEPSRYHSDDLPSTSNGAIGPETAVPDDVT